MHEKELIYRHQLFIKGTKQDKKANRQHGDDQAKGLGGKGDSPAHKNLQTRISVETI